MDVLKPTRGRGARLCALAAALSLAGCMLARHAFPGGSRFGFSHELHVTEEGLDCFSCHETALMADDPGMPELDSCMVCHETIDEERPPAKRVRSLFVDGVFQGGRVSALEDELIFSHLRHAAGDQHCADCHTDIETNVRVGPELALGMDDCTTCHAVREAPNDCADCHTVIREDWVPESHHHNWDRVHGIVARSECTRTVDDCELCHTESTCVACHMVVPPVSHNNYFRRRGHGLVAMMDRASCAACHRTDSCDRCHAEVQPMNHTGAFGGTVSTHCITCHFPLQHEACVTCHKSTPRHLSTPKPPGHHPAMDCRQCHGVTASLPHMEKGDDCNLCHP